MKRNLAIILFVGIIACHQTKQKQDTKILDFGLFTLETPQSWTKIKARGIDSYVGSIAIDNKDTLHFDLGWYPDNLYEYDPTILDSNMMKDIDTSRTNINDVIFVNHRMQVDPDTYRKNNVLWDTINEYKSKIVYPRRSGIGTTGIYIDSLWVSGSDVDRFNLYGQNLKSENEKKVLQVLRSLRFRKSSGN